MISRMQTSRREAGFTLVELMVSMVVSSVALGGLTVASSTLQRSFEAANYQMTSQNDQLRVLDFLSRDLRMASALSVLDSGGKITVTLPSSPTATVTLNLGPLLAPLLGTPSATATTQTVSYYVEGGQLIREVNGVQTMIADTVDAVAFTRQGAFLTTSILFTPQFSASPTTADQQATSVTSNTYLRNLPPGS